MFVPPDASSFPDVTWSTSDLCDELLSRPEWNVQVVQTELQSFGGRSWYFGEIVTVIELPGWNPSLQPVLSSPGAGRVLVVNAKAAGKAAIFGDRMAALAVQNGWVGIILDGYVRDTAMLARMPLGVHALGKAPNRATDMRPAATGGTFDLYGAAVLEQHWAYVDADGIVLINRRHTSKLADLKS